MVFQKDSRNAINKTMTKKEAKLAVEKFLEEFGHGRLHPSINGGNAQAFLKDGEWTMNVYLETNADDLPTHFEGLRLHYEHVGKFVAE
jgi:hypothetical protein